MKRSSFLPRTFCLAVALLLAGCASAPSARFYALTPLDQKESQASSPQGAIPRSVSIAPVEIPDYLDRPQIVTRDGRNELILAEFDRWAGSLQDNITTVLMDNLSLLLGSDRIFIHPRVRTEKSDYLLVLRILRLDCTPGDQVLLKAQWTVFSDQDRVGVSRMATLTEPLADNRYETLAAAASSALAQLSREIARDLRKQP
ncbi:MAG: hypothetical protein A4E72_02139 [Syntrophus sp. PtaU1.Bin208]|nr:MAG: hypothetical protein A4E72_02139 [Syntrophus sp. PtaU1.Bin208]